MNEAHTLVSDHNHETRRCLLTDRVHCSVCQLCTTVHSRLTEPREYVAHRTYGTWSLVLELYADHISHPSSDFLDVDTFSRQFLGLFSLLAHVKRHENETRARITSHNCVMYRQCCCSTGSAAVQSISGATLIAG